MSTCFAYRNPTFQPAMRLIASITQSNPATITTTFEHQYKTGTIVRFEIPSSCGMQELNSTPVLYLTYPITVTGDTTFTVPVDSTNFQAFSIPVFPSPHVNTCAQVIPTGEINSILTAATQNVLPYPAS